MTEPRPDRVRVSGPLSPFAEGYSGHLAALGYLPASVRTHLELLAQVSRWMECEGLDVRALSPRAVERFRIERRHRGYVSKLSPTKLRPLLGYLDGLGVLGAVAPVAPTEVDRLIGEFCDYLARERGLVPGSVTLYARVAGRFLEERSQPMADALARLSGAEVNAFVLGESARVRPRTAETVVCALRALLRFLHIHGWTTARLATAVPSVPQRREGLPRALPAGQLGVLLDSCDRTTPVGCRDHTILLLLARLGLRCGEVAGVTLDDLDWRAGELVVHGKRSRTDRLPLPCDVGEALCDYLRRARPPGFGRTVFLRSQAPIGPLSGDGVSEVVVRAGHRAGIGPIRAHRLRHTVATEMLRRGAGLVEIGQVLRHQSLEVTAVYAKVDRSALSQLALPWPGGQS
jgi:site-specific recombinase XerD